MSFGEENNQELWMHESDHSPELSYERSREIISQGIVAPVEELVTSGVLENPRVVLFGSSVTEPKEPRDLDVMLVYDRFSTGRWLSRSYSQSAEDIAGTIYQYQNIENQKDISGHIHIANVDIPILSSERLEHYLKTGPEENREIFMNIMAKIFSRAEKLEERMNLSENLDEEMHSIRLIAENIPYLLLTVNGVDPTLYAKEKYQNYSEIADILELEGQDASKQLYEEITEVGISRLFDGLSNINPELAERAKEAFDNDPGQIDTLAAKEVLADIVRFSSKKIEEKTTGTDLENAGYVVSKGIRQMVSTYNQGYNFVQASLLSGAVQLYGEPLEIDENVPYDNRFISDKSGVAGDIEFEDARQKQLHEKLTARLFLSNEARTEIYDQYGKEYLLKYMRTPDLNLHELWQVWRIVGDSLDANDLPYLIDLAQNPKVMCFSDRSIRGSLLPTMRNLLTLNDTDQVQIPDDFFKSTSSMLLRRMGRTETQVDRWVLALMDLKELYIIGKELNIDARITANMDIGDFDMEFLNDYLRSLQESDLSDLPVFYRAMSIELRTGHTMINEKSISELENFDDSYGYEEDSSTQTDSTDQDSSWGDEPAINSSITNLTDKEQDTLSFHFLGRGLDLGIYTKEFFISIQPNLDMETVNNIVGEDTHLIGKIDFTPGRKANFSWGNMTNSFYEGMKDIQDMFKIMDSADVELRYVGGITNPQMAAFANRMGFEHTFLSKNHALYPLTPKQLKGLAAAVSKHGDGLPINMSKIGISQIQSEQDLSLAYVVVLGDIDTIKERVDQLENSGLFDKISKRQNRLASERHKRLNSTAVAA